MENNNNNGRGVFYGVIGVATLVVTIIGATFAYFSASISGGNQAIATNAANISLAIAENIVGIKGAIVPVDEHKSHTGFSTGGYVGDTASVLATDADNCIDEDGNPFCSVYSFTITNPSTAAQTVYARMDVASNTFTENEKSGGTDDAPECNYLGYDTSAEILPTRTVTDNKTAGEDKSAVEVYCGNSNLAFAIFKGTPAQVKAKGWKVLTAVTDKYTPSTSTTVPEGATKASDATADGNVANTAVVGALGDLVVSRTAVPTGTGARFEFDALTQTLKPNGSVTYTVLVWLHETWQNQEDDEAKSFAAGITFSTAQGGSGVTAVLGQG